MILSQMSPAQRRKLLAHAPLKRYTPKTVVDLDRLEDEFKRVRGDGYATDDEEFLPGLVCAAVLVPNESGRSNLCVAVQAPVVRLTTDKAVHLLPPLQRAARAIHEIEAEGSVRATR
jgi:DNA-binding IclR family transcriptional regulator